MKTHRFENAVKSAKRSGFTLRVNSENKSILKRGLWRQLEAGKKKQWICTEVRRLLMNNLTNSFCLSVTFSESSTPSSVHINPCWFPFLTFFKMVASRGVYIIYWHCRKRIEHVTVSKDTCNISLSSFPCRQTCFIRFRPNENDSFWKRIRVNAASVNIFVTGSNILCVK